MNKEEFAERISERTGLDTETAAAVLDRIEEFNIFGKKERADVRAAIAETAGCDEKQAEKIRKEVLSVIKGEAKSQAPKCIACTALFIATAVVVIKLIKRRKDK